MEGMLKSVFPAVNLDDYVGPAPVAADFDLEVYQAKLRALSIPDDPSPVASPADSSLPSDTPSPEHVPDVESEEYSYVPDTSSAPVVKSLTRLKDNDIHWRHHGKAASSHFILHFQELKHQSGEQSNFFEALGEHKRQDFWHVPEWEVFIMDVGLNPLGYSVWPDEGLDQQLINAYFDHVNVHLPLLNRHIFQRDYDSGLWKSQQRFGRVCLLIFACGSRFFSNPGTFWHPAFSKTQGTGKDYSAPWLQYSAGWRYLHMALHMGQNPVRMPDLYELQAQALICHFLQAGTEPARVATIAGSALRSAQDIGIHSKVVLERLQPADRELYKRAFWCLFHLDRQGCTMLGRSVAMADSDYDVPFPEDLDDEYWSLAGGVMLQQPSGRISRVRVFIEVLKLDQILGQVLQLLYASRKTTRGPTTRRAAAMELDATLDAWVSSIPPSLRWDPHRTNHTLFRQTATLWTLHAYIKMLIHRNLIPPRRNVATHDQLSSLASCVTAALSICSISDSVLSRSLKEGSKPGQALDISALFPAWLAGIVLLISIYAVDQTPLERRRAENGIRACLRAARELEVNWKLGGKIADFIEQFLRESGGLDSQREAERRAFRQESGTPTKPVYASPQGHESGVQEQGQGQGQGQGSSEKEAQRKLFESWVRMNTFENQLKGMKKVTLGQGEDGQGAGEGQGEGDEDRWGRVSGNQM
ncbi:hypothetical protein L202_06351 [Cryptococcus amylolentus CBS 6039]|uniref:Xylanolytic transcriptional activator regulatory domain-containing protein n=1 Tax=Cryptococcus amylolentus CBS 6039 TaxID=1295533 RepID=A0A1E3HHB8_9TREE|nr:hypothetical protein L202_06351 [Cryptococcus amylolentus CBS 6039]ODN75146.1 hypothetical protein L202_06351 [Cryptococcus amylolentus CBS 6039]